MKSPEVFYGARAQIFPHSDSSFPKSFFFFSHGLVVAVMTLLIGLFLPVLSTTERYS